MLATSDALVTAYGSVQVGDAVGNRLSIVGLDLTCPRVNAAGAVILLLACLGVVTIVRGFAAAAHLVRTQRRFVDELSVLGPLADRRLTVVFDDARPQAFCAGYLKSCVYVSAGAALTRVLAGHSDRPAHRGVYVPAAQRHAESGPRR